jgi:hypothetical protein
MSYRDRISPGRPSFREIWETMTRTERLLFGIAIVNFVVFVAVAIPLGGDAINGTARDGHYYLREHATYTEVSKPVFVYSTIHTLSLFITHPLGIIVAIRARLRCQEEG